MIDLSSSDVSRSTREKAEKWAAQKYVMAGWLTLWDAANLLSRNSYGGIFRTRSEGTRWEITHLYRSLKEDLKGPEFLLEGYEAHRRVRVPEPELWFAGEPADQWVLIYPVIAFRDWHRRTGLGDGRYFEKNAREVEKSQNESGAAKNEAKPSATQKGIETFVNQKPQKADWPYGETISQANKSLDAIEIIEGVTVADIKALLDEKNEGTTFCPRLLAAIRVELELNAMRAQVKAPNNFTFVYRKSEDDCRKELIEKHCKTLKIFNCNDSDALKQSGRRTVTPQDKKPIERVLMHEREAKTGRTKKP